MNNKAQETNFVKEYLIRRRGRSWEEYEKDCMTAMLVICLSGLLAVGGIAAKHLYDKNKKDDVRKEHYQVNKNDVLQSFIMINQSNVR